MKAGDASKLLFSETRTEKEKKSYRDVSPGNRKDLLQLPGTFNTILQCDMRMHKGNVNLID
ncbi:unnamed protein product [Larinioides sclopetarius]|uniref:Uncharacterized protein n=1 Tax=Larinioides sclopetarius TaxID=280406 RepID=A0AAV1ZG78_9ARAC